MVFTGADSQPARLLVPAPAGRACRTPHCSHPNYKSLLPLADGVRIAGRLVENSSGWQALSVGLGFGFIASGVVPGLTKFEQIGALAVLQPLVASRGTVSKIRIQSDNINISIAKKRLSIERLINWSLRLGATRLVNSASACLIWPDLEKVLKAATELTAAHCRSLRRLVLMLDMSCVSL